MFRKKRDYLFFAFCYKFGKWESHDQHFLESLVGESEQEIFVPGQTYCPAEIVAPLISFHIKGDFGKDPDCTTSSYSSYSKPGVREWELGFGNSFFLLLLGYFSSFMAFVPQRKVQLFTLSSCAIFFLVFLNLE